MDAFGIEIRKDSWTLVHVKSSLFSARVEGYSLLSGAGCAARLDELKTYISRKCAGAPKIAIVMPREFSLCGILHIPAHDYVSAGKILKFEVERQLPFAPDLADYGFHIIKTGKDLSQVFLAASKRDFIDDISGEFRNSGIEPDYICNWQACLLSGLLYHKRISDGKKTTVISLSRAAVSLDIFAGLKPVYSRWIGTSRTGLKDIVKRELNLSRLSTGTNQKIDECLVISEAEPEKEFLSWLEENTGAPARADAPLQAAPALGGALSILGKGAVNINMARRHSINPPAAYPLAQKLTAVISFLAVFTGASHIITDWLDLRRLRPGLVSINAEKRSLQKIADSLRSIEGRVNTLDGIKGAGIFPPLDILKELTLLLPHGTWLSSFEYKDGVITIEGYSEGASMLLIKMGRSEVIRDFEFEGPVTKGPQDKERFRMKCRLKTTPTTKEREF